MRILMLLTSGPEERPSETVGLDQVVESYYLLQDAGAEVVVASKLGGAPHVRGARRRSAAAAGRRFQDDQRARDVISDTLTFDQIYAEDFDGGVCLGALEEQAGSEDAPAAFNLVKALLTGGKPVVVVPRELLAQPTPLEGLLIVGDQVRSPAFAAKALLAALGPLRAGDPPPR